MTSIGLTELQGIISKVRGIMEEQRDHLIKIDGEMGDGDLGITMEKAFVAADDYLSSYDADDLGKGLMQMGMTMAKAAPSTMGTLLATGFMRGGKAVQGKNELTVGDLATMFRAFSDGLMERGKSKPGDKTIIDVMAPVAESLESTSDDNLAHVFRSAYDAAAKGLQNTKEMTAQHGRPAYYQEKSVGKADPGGTAGLYLIQGFKDYLESAK